MWGIAGVDGCGFVGAVARSGLGCCGFAGAIAHGGSPIFWVVGHQLWVIICVLFVSFPMGMVCYEDVCEFSGEFYLHLGLDCRVGHDGERVGLWWLGERLVEMGVLVVKCKLIIIIIINK